MPLPQDGGISRKKNLHSLKSERREVLWLVKPQLAGDLVPHGPVRLRGLVATLALASARPFVVLLVCLPPASIQSASHRRDRQKNGPLVSQLQLSQRTGQPSSGTFGPLRWEVRLRTPQTPPSLSRWPPATGLLRHTTSRVYLRVWPNSTTRGSWQRRPTHPAQGSAPSAHSGRRPR